MGRLFLCFKKEVFCQQGVHKDADCHGHLSFRRCYIHRELPPSEGRWYARIAPMDTADAAISTASKTDTVFFQFFIVFYLRFADISPLLYDYIILLYIIKTRSNVQSVWFIFGKMRPFLKQKSVLKIWARFYFLSTKTQNTPAGIFSFFICGVFY